MSKGPTTGASARRYQSFAEFWPFYVGEHARKANRLLHCFGTLTAIGVAISVGASATSGSLSGARLLLLPAGIAFGYACAWVGHFMIEKNVPATFTYPVWSFFGDLKMLAFTLVGRMDDEVAQLLARASDRLRSPPGG